MRDIISTLVLLFVMALPLSAETRAVGIGGEVYYVQVGLRGEFESGSSNGDYWVLALEVTYPNGDTEVLIVPGSEDENAEYDPQLEWDEATAKLILTWQSQNLELFQLHMVEYGTGEFRSLLAESGDQVYFENIPILYWTHSSTSANGGQGSRSVLHLFWRDEIGSTFYRPVVVANGDYYGVHRTISISNLLRRTEDPRPGLDYLNSRLWVTVGEDHRLLVLVIADPLEGRLSTVAIKMVPEELVGLADLGRRVIVGGGGQGGPATSWNFVPEAVEFSEVLHPSILAGIANSLRVELDNYQVSGGTDSQEVVDLARIVIIGGGITAGDGGVYLPTDPDQSTLIELTDELDIERTSHFFQVTIVREFTIPDIPENAEIFVSVRGDHLAIAWPENGGVAWIKDSGDGWIQNLMIPVGFGLSLEEAMSLIERQTRHR